ncbi:hypothetical protein O3G_MSEX005886 [Manduca sexta]|uniref:Uncharacterized protein n=1 Tax=Manduca sexta TaxID=7130 RepID=A0A921Z074_MANSE|nr:hypothetical protein O3G_MSEX005886 [Manduca sexta]
MAKQDDGLFLLEVLIDKVVFLKSPCFSDKDFRTCVNIECPAVEPMEICDDDPGACVAKSGGPFVKTFNNGKSCLFSLKEADISKAMSKFPIKISVYKSLPCGCLPTKIVMGEATIDMTKEFVQARKKFLEDPNNVSYQALKDAFRIVGPDGAETGEIVMFLRISCFGKLIITKFQGVGRPPNLGGGGGGAIVDRSCNPRKDYQTTQDPCACGAARSAGGGGSATAGSGQPCNMGVGGAICPPARDPYNSMPCEDPDDPCYCSGPKGATKQQMVCMNTDQYCLHVPKGTLPRLPRYQELTEEKIIEIRSMYPDVTSSINYSSQDYIVPKERLQNGKEVSRDIEEIKKMDKKSAMSFYSLSSKKRSVSFSDTISYASNLYQKQSYYSIDKYNSSIKSLNTFGNRETAVYMTLYNDFSRRRTSGTQATASINKCLQVNTDDNIIIPYEDSSMYSHSNYCSSCTVPEMLNLGRRSCNSGLYSEIYFFGRKKDEPSKMGMGLSGSKTKLHRTGQGTAASVKSEKGGYHPRGTACIQAQSQSYTTGAQTRCRGASMGTSTGKAVSIRDEKPERPCPAVMGTKGDMVATVSHIRIGPREPCPVHGKEPCQGPKCIIASSGEDQAPVKVTTVTNPRRGVFELVIRRMTGAPLAKNELMLEWTPPPSRPPPCGIPCPVVCAFPAICRPQKCKMIVCRPSSCKPVCKKICRKPCGPPNCKPLCKKCCKPSCCNIPCRSCRPCGRPPRSKACVSPPRCRQCRSPPRCRPCRIPSPCRPCSPSSCGACPSPPRCRPCSSPPRCRPCASPPRCQPCSPCPPYPRRCCQPPGQTPCKSSPCLRPCPVGRKKTRKARSQPRIKSHKKRISPCLNRTKVCAVARCRSVPGPCSVCCYYATCLPRRCCHLAPCITPKCCRSSCST